MPFRMTRGTKRKAQKEEGTSVNLFDVQSISDADMQTLLVNMQEEQIKRRLIQNKPKKLKLIIKEVKVDAESDDIHLTFEGIDTISITDLCSPKLIHAGTVLIQCRWLDIDKFSGSWTLQPFTQIEKKHQGGNPQHLLQILHKLNSDNVCSYWEVLKWLLEAVNGGEKEGDEQVKKWVEKKLDNTSDSDDEETVEERHQRTKWLEPVPAWAVDFMRPQAGDSPGLALMRARVAAKVFE